MSDASESQGEDSLRTAFRESRQKAREDGDPKRLARVVNGQRVVLKKLNNHPNKKIRYVAKACIEDIRVEEPVLAALPIVRSAAKAQLPSWMQVPS
jgi:hypothetical protein